MKYKVRINGCRKSYTTFYVVIEVEADSPYNAREKALIELSESEADGDSLWGEDVDSKNNFSTDIEIESSEILSSCD